VSDVRTRFAPSPTGHLHLGGARTALFNYLYARRHGGRFVLRIEDTDRQRSAQEYVDAILSGLDWLGLSHDEGPYYQSQRMDLYASRVEQLLDNGHAYHCFCSPASIEAKREQAQKEGRRAVYDRTCRDLGRRPAAGESAVVRFKAPMEGRTIVDDMVRGRVTFDNRELDDLILVRSDETPTFHLVVVVDDIDMGITHILRGEDHLTNTPKQIQIFHALTAEPPRYGHLPLIVGTDRARLSKRHGATAVSAYRAQGFLPDAVVNYLARLGWSHGDDEIFTRSDLERLFDVDGVGKAAAAFDMEKFTWVNFQHMKAMEPLALAAALEPHLAERGVAAVPDDRLASVVALLKERSRTLVELADASLPYVGDELRYDEKAVAKFLGEEERGRLIVLADELAGLDPWTAGSIESAFSRVLERLEIKLGKMAQPARVALTGGTQSPGIFEVCEVLGRDRTVARLRSACERAAAGTLTSAPASC
jgi:glutamyl-tRNA synthetase